MARRGGASNKCVEEKRRQLPIYQHYTLSPGKTKSHHPEAKCVHCQKEFVCGSKQRLIRHIRKCNSISNPEHIIAETLNTLARNSATGQLNHSILEASNLLPSQISQIQNSATQHLVGQAIHQNIPNNSSTVTTANSININNGNLNASVSLLSGDPVVATSSNGSTTTSSMKARRGRKPGGRNSMGPGIHVTTGLDGKTHFMPASQLTPEATHGSPQIIAQAHNGRARQVSYTYQAAVPSNPTSVNSITATGAHLNAPNSGHLQCATTNHHSSSPFKLNSELIDRAYLKLVLTRNLPLSLCDTKEFQAWLKTFANDYKPPSSINLITQNLKQEAQSARYRVNNILVKAPKKTINLELHCWPDIMRGHSWCAIIAGIDHKRLLISVKDLLAQFNHQRVQDQQSNLSFDKLFNEFIDENINRVGSDRINSLIIANHMGSDANVDLARKSLYTTHPSIVTYHCWWHSTNMLCSDVIEHKLLFATVMKNANMIINFINKRPQLQTNLERFGPFAGAAGTLFKKKDVNRWYSHLVCYLLQYLKNNKETLLQALGSNLTSNYSFYRNDNNNNSSVEPENSQSDAQQDQNTGTQSNNLGDIFSRDPQQEAVKSIVMSDEFWETLDSALVYLKPFLDILALTPIANNNQNGRINQMSTVNPTTPVISPTSCSNLSLSEYMDWFLRYGKSLIDIWKQSSTDGRYQLIDRYIQRFVSSINEFKLLFAAYLLSPKHRCAYMTQRAKDSAIEEILNIASEFMPEESDGHTIFDQWKLYLLREEPYDMVFDESRSSPLDWWMSLPCPESIRRVALRILRLKAFSSPKPETMFMPLYFYEDETKADLSATSFDDIAMLRYFYDHEDKISQSTNSMLNHHGPSTNHPNSLYNSNGFSDRTHVGYIHSDYLADSEDMEKILPSDSLNSNQLDTAKQNLSNNYESVVGPYNGSQTNMDVDYSTDCLLENLSGYKMFSTYVDFNDLGIQIVQEEPTEKKKRKWTAQEILSKCQSSR